MVFNFLKQLLQLFFNTKLVEVEVQEVKKILITLEDYLTASGKYPNRLNHPEVTEEVKKNAMELLAKVTKLLEYFNIESVKVSSGFRPQTVNANIANAAKKSNHLTGNAIDLLDLDEALDTLFNDESTLEMFGLYLEHPSATKTWTHLQQIAPRSGRRIFKP